MQEGGSLQHADIYADAGIHKIKPSLSIDDYRGLGVLQSDLLKQQRYKSNGEKIKSKVTTLVNFWAVSNLPLCKCHYLAQT